MPLAIRVGAELAGSCIVFFAIYAFSTFGSALFGINMAFIALATGVAYAAVTFIFAKVSGGQFNPAITLASMLIGRTKPLDGVLYIVAQVLGGLIAYSIKFVGHAMPLLCVGGTCIMAGNLAMAGLFTASSRDYTPAGRAGASQSVKMVIYIMLPMVLASIIDPLIIRAVALEPTAAILAKYPSYAGSYLYPYELFLAAAVSAVFILIPAYFVRRDADRIRREKLAALEK